MGIMAAKRYDNANDVQMRLQNTVVRYKDRPVYVGQNLQVPVDPEGMLVECFDLLSQAWVDRVHSSDEDLDIRSSPLGYMNGDRGAKYVARQPARRQRQGLCVENTFVIRNDPGHELTITNITRPEIKSRAFGQMIVGEYPSFEEALRTLKDNKRITSQAFGRRLMITEDEIGLIKLHCFTISMAVYNQKKETFFIPEKFEYYMRMMKAYGVPCELEE